MLTAARRKPRPVILQLPAGADRSAAPFAVIGRLPASDTLRWKSFNPPWSTPASDSAAAIFKFTCA